MSKFNPNAGRLALPQGSLILITGVTGYIATHIVQEALAAGYKVRGTARSLAKASSDEAFHNNTNYHCVVVPDMLDPTAYDDVVRDCDGVIHTSSPTDMQYIPAEVITPLVKHIEGLLEACMRAGSVKRFVYTSSSTAATLPKPGRPGHLDKSTYNEEAIRIAWAEPHAPEKGYPIYGASKVEAERALWRFVETRNPGFVCNSVLPDTNFGKVLNGRMGPTGRCVVELVRKDYLPTYIPSQWMVNVRDDAFVHLAALLDADVSNERIYAFDEVFTWNRIIDILSEARPEDKERFDKLRPKDEVADATTVDNELGGQLLKKWFGQEGDKGRGWSGLRAAVEENLVDMPDLVVGC